ncbi:MAG: hypothetical protein IJT99_03645, partial [Clostridia bacterium]|nr:hypothetical protein [Clostridia bacterium]
MKRMIIWLVILTMLVTALPGTLPAAHANDAHTHQWSQWYTEYSATCDSSGGQYRYCELCYTYEYRDYPPALGHNWQEQIREQPTCTKDGYGIEICTRCSMTKDNGHRIPALGHNYQRKVAQEATCTKDGTAVYTCSRCGDSYREPIPATGHKWGEWVDGDPATCVQYGNRYHQCTRCGQKEWERNYAGGLGDHDWGDWVTVKEPTATEDGLKERVCKVDASHKEQEVIPATGEPAEEAKPALELDMELWIPELWVKGSESGSWVPNPDKEAISFEDQIRLNYYEVTNTGNVPLYYKVVVTTGNNVVLFDTGEFSRVFSGMLNPGEHDNDSEFGFYFYAYEEDIIPDPEDSPYAGTYRVTWIVYGYALDDTERTTPICKSNAYTFECKIAKQEEAKPALKLVVDQWEKVKEAYEPYDPKHYYKNSIGQQFIITNTGNVRLRYKIVGIAGNNVDMAAEYPNVRHYFSSGGALPPGYTDYGLGSSQVQYNYIVGMNGMIPDPEDSPYAGTDRVSYMVYGYAVDDTELTTPICQDGPVVFEYKIAKPGPEPWPIPEESQLIVDIYDYGSDDPAGYQLGEGWDTLIVIRNKGSVDIDDYTIHVEYVASYPCQYKCTTKGSGSYELPRLWKAKPLAAGDSESPNITWTYGDQSPWGYVAEEDVERGYIQVNATVKWIDPDSGNERAATGTCSMPVISKAGLLLNKGYKDPANSEYFEEGEQIEWTLSMKNNSREPIKDITITDNGATIGMFAEVTPEQGEIKLGVPKYTVTEYDAKVIGKVTNIANATGT